MTPPTMYQNSRLLISPVFRQDGEMVDLTDGRTVAALRPKTGIAPGAAHPRNDPFMVPFHKGAIFPAPDRRMEGAAGFPAAP